MLTPTVHEIPVTRGPERVSAYMAFQISAETRYPIWSVRYWGTRGTERVSGCKFNDAPAAMRHGAQLMGLVLR